MTHFVIPYIVPKNPAFGWELMFCLRAIENNFKGTYDITLIGECPKWINKNKIKFIKNNQTQKNIKSTAGKINDHYLVASELYNDFIVIHDDMYMVNQCNAETFKTPKIIETLCYNSSEESLNSFQESLREVYLLLEKHNKPNELNFISHVPFLVKSNELQELHDAVDLRNNYPFENMYFNYFEYSGENILNFKSGHYGPENEVLLNTARILNHDSKGFIYQPWIITLLFKLFPKSSIYEKPNTEKI